MLLPKAQSRSLEAACTAAGGAWLHLQQEEPGAFYSFALLQMTLSSSDCWRNWAPCSCARPLPVSSVMLLQGALGSSNRRRNQVSRSQGVALHRWKAVAGSVSGHVVTPCNVVPGRILPYQARHWNLVR